MVSEHGGEMRTHGPTRAGRETGVFRGAFSAMFCLDGDTSVLSKLPRRPEHDLLCLNSFECDGAATKRQISKDPIRAKNIFGHTHTHTLAVKSDWFLEAHCHNLVVVNLYKKYKKHNMTSDKLHQMSRSSRWRCWAWNQAAAFKNH